MRPSTYSIGSWLFLRILAAVHLIAFASAWTQIGGLAGPHGILPIDPLLRVLHAQFGASVWWRLPTLCWCFGGGWFLGAMCGAGVVLAALLFAGLAPALCLVLLWADYLSLACAGQIFFDYQWDALLLETTLLAVFLAPWSLRPGWRLAEPPREARWLLGWLLFRLMFLSGIVKLASGDPVWRNLTALAYHYGTQPLPTRFAWYAAHLPLGVQRACCAAMFGIELAAPFALLGPRRLRHAAVAALVGLQALIALTGNYAFFNLLAAALCLLAVDDSFWLRTPVRRLGKRAPETAPRAPPAWLLGAFAALVFSCTSLEALADFVPDLFDLAPVSALVGRIAPFRSLNNYGLFARMTTTRPELVIQGSEDGRDWLDYELPHKPGSLSRPPDLVAPFQPRLDWQLWFAALESPEENRWLLALCEHLLRGTPQVAALFARNPFPAAPPRFVRIVRYDYQFTTAAERSATGNWWKRDVLDFYVPPASLR